MREFRQYHASCHSPVEYNMFSHDATVYSTMHAYITCHVFQTFVLVRGFDDIRVSYILSRARWTQYAFPYPTRFAYTTCHLSQARCEKYVMLNYVWTGFGSSWPPSIWDLRNIHGHRAGPHEPELRHLHFLNWLIMMGLVQLVRMYHLVRLPTTMVVKHLQ